MIRQAGAKEVHFRVASSPITGPCYYGIDTPTRKELIAASSGSALVWAFRDDTGEEQTTLLQWEPVVRTVVFDNEGLFDFTLLEPSYFFDTQAAKAYRFASPLQALFLPGPPVDVLGHQPGDYHVIKVR